MFFTSYTFIFLFLPLAFVGFYALHRRRAAVAAEYWLVLLSLFFYWSLDGSHLLALIGSALVNYAVSLRLHADRRARPRAAFVLLWAGIGFNILFLATFKYAGTWFGPSFAFLIPLGISFFSIQQIAYLVGVYNEDGAPPSWRRYLLFVSFFPYVVAGPVVMKQEVLPQYDQMSAARSADMLLPAITLFSLGLFKKVVLADNIAPYVDKVFEAAAYDTTILASADAWIGAALFALQLYFDFSGYSDMAAALAGFFGVRLPMNFYSPFKAASIIEFWRRWHMSVTRFFTNFVYLPLVVKMMRIAVRRHFGRVTQYGFTVLLPMLATFVLIGIWHGAGPAAAVFGLLMGVALSINHVWIKLRLPALPKPTGWLLTMFVVVCGMVFSRADSMHAAIAVLRGMFGLSGGADVLLDRTAALSWLAILAAVALFAPNTHEIMNRARIVLDEAWDSVSRWQPRFEWTHGPWGTVFASFVFSVAVVSIPKAAQFLYYRF